MTKKIALEDVQFGGKRHSDNFSSSKDANPEVALDQTDPTENLFNAGAPGFPIISKDALGMQQYHNLDRFGYEAFDERPLTDNDRLEVVGPTSAPDLAEDQQDLRTMASLVDGYYELSQTLESYSELPPVHASLVRTMVNKGQTLARKQGVSTEAFQEGKITLSIAQEGLGRAIQDIWEAIVRVVNRIWKKIISFFTTSDVQGSYIDMRLDRMESFLRGAEGLIPKVPLINPGMSYQRLGKGSGEPQGPREILSGLTDYITMARRVLHEYTGHVEMIGHRLTEAARRNQEDPMAWVSSMNAVGSTFGGQRLYDIVGATRQIVHPQYPNDLVHTSFTLTGGRVLLVVEHRKEDNEDLLEETSRYTQAEVLLTYRHDYNPAEIKEIIPYGVSELRELCQLARELNNVSKQHDGKEMMHRLKRVQDDLSNACKAMPTKTKEHAEMVGRALHYVDAFSRWCLHPTAEVTASLQQIANQVVSFVGANVEAYRVPRS